MRAAPTHVAPETKRPSARKRGYTRAWEKASKVYLAEHALCEICLAKGTIEPSEVVDHIIPHRGDNGLFWNQSNWQALSKRCHDRKTATEDSSFARTGPRRRAS